MQRAEETILNLKSNIPKFPEKAIPNPERDTSYLISAPEPLNLAACSFDFTVICRPMLDDVDAVLIAGVIVRTTRLQI